MQQNAFLTGIIDYFKIFKVLDLKKIQKTGIVKIILDKHFNRKILSVQGNISTNNFITFQTSNIPNISFSQRYLYIQGYVEGGKSFCMQVSCTLGNKQYKAVYSSLYKNAKKHIQNIIHLPLNLHCDKWNICVIDLYELGVNFGYRVQQIKLIFKVTAIQIRASSKVKGLFQSDYLYNIQNMPKQLSFSLKNNEQFFQKYHYFVETSDESLNKVQTKLTNQNNKQKTQNKINKNKSTQKHKNQNQINQQNNSKNIKPQHKKPQPNLQQKIENNKKIVPKVKNKNIKRQNIQMQNNQIQQIQQEIVNIPKPQTTLSVNLCCVQGFSQNYGFLASIQSYILKPVYMPTHKPISIIKSVNQLNLQIITCYKDGSVCIWDLRTKKPISYFLTQLNEIKLVTVDNKHDIVLIGLDKIKRQVINVVSKNNIIFRQISNYSILGITLIHNQSFQSGFVTFGFQNIRIWKVNNQKSIISGSNVYLGQTSRNVKYNCSVIIQIGKQKYAIFGDSNGFITTININSGKMVQSLKVDEIGIDCLLLLKGQNRDRNILICSQSGNIKKINLQNMTIMQQLNISNRIKNIYQIHTSNQFIITHYNKSIAQLNIQSGSYSFMMRSHTSSIIKLAYNSTFNKLISISKDSTIRIWQYVQNDQNILPFRLQQQYQFIINGQQMMDVVVGQQGKNQDLRYAYIGSSSGKIRKIDIDKFTITQQIILEQTSVNLGISKNGKFIIASYFNSNSYLLDNNLKILHKYKNQLVNKRKIKKIINGFNRANKQLYIQNIQQNKLEVYSLRDISQPIYQISMSNAIYADSYQKYIFIITKQQINIYQHGNLTKIISLQRFVDKKQDLVVCMCYPVLCFSNKSKLIIQVLSSSLVEQVQLPQQINNLTVTFNYQSHNGYIFCSGEQSFALYTIQYQLNNLNHLSINLSTQYKHQIQQQNNNMQLSFSQTCKTTFHNPIKNIQFQNIKMQESPKQLNKAYQFGQQLYQQIKQYIIPNCTQKQEEEIQEETENIITVFDKNQKQKQIKVLLNYGYDTFQTAKTQNQIGHHFWINQSNSLILITNKGKGIVQHFFTIPVHNKTLFFGSSITSMSISQSNYDSVKYLIVCLNSIIKIYNVNQEISLIKSITSISQSFPHNIIFQSSVTNCNRFVLILSVMNVNFDNKIYIHVIQIMTAKVVSSSYFSLPTPKNKYKGYQIKQAYDYKLKLNPYNSTLQFVLFNSQGQFNFYRMTSIFTLQTIQLQQLPILCRDKVSLLTEGCFLCFGQSNIQYIFAVGTENGSIVFIDTRSANILIACVKLINNSNIKSLSYFKASQPQQSKLIIYTKSTNVYVFDLFQGLNTLIQSMQKHNQIQKYQKTLILDAQVSSISNVSTQGQQIVITKCGSLWLLDSIDLVTVKVSSVHTALINQAEVIQTIQNQSFLMTCSDDGSVKISNLANLQQTLQIFKPRKKAKCYCFGYSFTLVAFGDEIYIYEKIKQNYSQHINQLNSFGTFKLDNQVLNVQNINATDNYYILTDRQLFIVYIGSKEIKNKSQVSLKSLSQLVSPKIKKQAIVQIHKITDIQHGYKVTSNNLFSPFDQLALQSIPGKVSIWLRKNLKRNANPIQQLTKVHQISYYLIDSTSRNSSNNTYVNFISQNQYVWGIYQQSLIQIRNYRQHSIVRQISLSIPSISTMISSGNNQLNFILGDQHGYVHVVNQNGLVLQKIKALQCKISSLYLWNNKNQNHIVVTGLKYVSISSTITSCFY